MGVQMKPSQKTIQEWILSKYVESSSHRTTTSLISDGMNNEILFPEQLHTSRKKELVNRAVWTLLQRGLLIPKFGRQLYFPLTISERGKAVASEEDFNPDFPERYLELLDNRVKKLSKTVKTYVKESLETFSSTCYFATSVMLGLASEAAFLEMSKKFAIWLQVKKDEKALQSKLDAGNTKYSRIYSNVRNKLLSDIKTDLKKAGLADNLELLLDAGNVLRTYRNEAGHPLGKVVQREECILSFYAMPLYLERLYELQNFFALKKVSEQ